MSAPGCDASLWRAAHSAADLASAPSAPEPPVLDRPAVPSAAASDEQIGRGDPSPGLAAWLSLLDHPDPDRRRAARWALAGREARLGAHTITAAGLQLLHRLLGVHGPLDYQNQLIEHAPSRSAADKQHILGTRAWVQKTVSVAAGDTLLLVSTIGERRASREELRWALRELGRPPDELRRCHFNPASLDPGRDLGLAPGMVSPFLPPARPTPLRAVIYLDVPVSIHPTGPDATGPDATGPEMTAPVAVSLSLTESLLIPRAVLARVLSGYARAAYPQLPLLLHPPLGDERRAPLAGQRRGRPA